MLCAVCCSDHFGALAPSRGTEMPRSGRRSHKTPESHDAPALRMCRRGPRHGAPARHVLNTNAIQKMLCEKTFGPKMWHRAAAEARAVDEQPQRRTHRRCGRGGGGAGRAGRRTYAGPRAARRAAECCAMVMAVSQNQIAIRKCGRCGRKTINLMHGAAERGHLAAAAGHAQACPRARELSRGRSRAPVVRSRRSRHAHAPGGRGCGGRDPKG